MELVTDDWGQMVESDELVDACELQEYRDEAASPRLMIWATLEKMAAEKQAPHTWATIASMHSTSVCAVRLEAYPRLDIVATPQ
eukprot:CAMPEP_0174751142 /NCGR_PEP_ID=MMETSP1094-20130205/99217_1 /TAXON_ID=156173 /ORGANISM="Chrysochromulina brevifilum, Strain UTEX LB 985" /LENGTH=83 /DNA_ID=CAMNT_0015956583 /DNA_START=75 /DNA_END=327 /DNA_ORIENTATION=+